MRGRLQYSNGAYVTIKHPWYGVVRFIIEMFDILNLLSIYVHIISETISCECENVSLLADNCVMSQGMIII